MNTKEVKVTNTGINGTSISMLRGKSLPVNTTKTLKELDINYDEFLENYHNPFSTIKDLERKGILEVEIVSNKLIVVYGPMFSGKSTKVLELLDNRPTISFRTSFSEGIVGSNITEFIISDPYEILVNAEKDFIVYIEGIHLHDPGTFKIVLNKLIKDGYEVVCSGIDTSWQGKKFLSTDYAISIGIAVKCVAKCYICGKDAEYTSYQDNIYEPKCQEHFEWKL